MSYGADIPEKAKKLYSSKMLISMPDALLKKVDKFAESEGFSRSELIRVALKEYIRKNALCPLSTKDIIDS
jgi:metal-responsive CopG/Arc/MetJ family transcriptional regulator